MAQDPNPAVNLAGSGVLLHVRNPSGEFVPVQGDADGLIGVSTQTGLSATGPVPLAPKTVPTGTAEAIVSVSTPVTRMVRVTSDFANTKTVYVSGTGVTVANGQPLGPGDVYTRNDINNANLLFCISADALQVLRIEVL